MRESDWLAAKKCGVRGCPLYAQHSRYKIAVLYVLGIVASVEVLLCDEHAEMADKDGSQFVLTQEEACREWPS